MRSFFNSSWKSRLTLLAQNREVKTKENIINELTSKGFRKEYTIELIDFLSNYLPIDNFPIESDDDILKDYNVDHEDLGNFYSSVLSKKSIAIPSRKEQDDFLKDKNHYPISLVLEFLMWCERLSIG